MTSHHEGRPRLFILSQTTLPSHPSPKGQGSRESQTWTPTCGFPHALELSSCHRWGGHAWRPNLSHCRRESPHGLPHALALAWSASLPRLGLLGELHPRGDLVQLRREGSLRKRSSEPGKTRSFLNSANIFKHLLGARHCCRP